MNTPFFEFKKLTKTFTRTRACDAVDLKAEAGEIIALCGENGAGKSTLMKVLCGLHPHGSYEGKILKKGRELSLHSPREAREFGIRLIHQEAHHVGALSVEENLFLGEEPLKRGGFLDFEKRHRSAREVLEKLEFSLPLTQLVETLSVGDQQLLEIAKALKTQGDIIVFDEPTTSLNSEESLALLEKIKKLKEQSVLVFYISHKLDEVMHVADRIVVMRDGAKVYDKAKSETDLDTLISHMTGVSKKEIPVTEAAETVVTGDPVLAPILLKIENLKTLNQFEGLSFDLKQEEILGFAGLLGSGRSELAYLLFGYGDPLNHPILEGRLELNGKPYFPSSPSEAIRHRMALVTEDRKRNGLILEHSLSFNITAPQLCPSLYGSSFLPSSDEENQDVDFWLKELNVKYHGDSSQPAQNLSGGNQQKLILAKWLKTKPQLLIMDEPTKGVDVGARQEIYGHIKAHIHQKPKATNRESGGEARGALVFSSDIDELRTLCDRILVMKKGKILGQLTEKRPDTYSSEELIRIFHTYLTNNAVKHI